MARVGFEDLAGGENPNPSHKFFEWKSNEKSLVHYDKGASDNITSELPFKFAMLGKFHCVRGWHDTGNDETSSRLFSNEVFSLGKQELSVRSFKGGELVTGLWKDIKDRALKAGGIYHRSFYVMLEDGSVANIILKKSAYAVWMDFEKNLNSNDEENNWIVISGAEDKKKGAIKYSVPVFEVGKKLTKNELTKADEAAELVSNYFQTKFDSNKNSLEDDSAAKEMEVVDAEELDDSDIDF